MKKLTLLLISLFLISCESVTETTGNNSDCSSHTDTIFTTTQSDSINLVVKSPCRFMVDYNPEDNTSTSAVDYYARFEDFNDSNGIVVVRVPARSGYTSIHAYLDGFESMKYDNDITIHRPQDCYGYYFNASFFKWEVVRMDSVFREQLR